MLTHVNTTELAVFLFFFFTVTAIGFIASRWRSSSSHSVEDWGLGGRQFGTLVTWFLVGGDFYTAYTMIAVPGLIYGVGAMGFFALPYTIIVYPFVFIAMPRLWSVCERHGLITPADFVLFRYGSQGLASAIAITGMLALMPYIALQLVGMEVVLTQMGFTGSTPFLRNLPITVAFAFLAAYTYSAGLRAPALIAFVKDAMIYIVVIAAVLFIPPHFGGYQHIFATAATRYSAQHPPASLILRPGGYSAYATLALGSALAAFMYPHTITSILASANGRVIRRNAVLLPAYTLLLGLIAILGIVAVAVGVHVTETKQAVPALLALSFPHWFVGFCFSAIAIAALVPAAIMSIAAANLFTRNLYLPYLSQGATHSQQAQVAKLASLLTKFGALVFVLFFPTQYAVNLQLLGGIWILQTFPSIALGLWSRWFHHRALLIGWAAGMALGTWLTYLQHLQSSVWRIGTTAHNANVYIGVLALALNLTLTAVLTILFDRTGIARHADRTSPDDYLRLDKQSPREAALGSPA